MLLKMIPILLNETFWQEKKISEIEKENQDQLYNSKIN